MRRLSRLIGVLRDEVKSQREFMEAREKNPRNTNHEENYKEAAELRK
jgi:hypothetical protein